MRLTLLRADFSDEFTRGRLLVDGKAFCFTIEDTDRKLEDGGVKIYGETAVPRGTYRIVMTHSPRFGRYLPLLVDVPQFSGVRIHPGNTAKDTEGCILVGEAIDGDPARIANSRVTFGKLAAKIQGALDFGETVILEIR